MEEPIVICGFGGVGQTVANILASPALGRPLPYIAFDNNPARVQVGRLRPWRGCPVYFQVCRLLTCTARSAQACSAEVVTWPANTRGPTASFAPRLADDDTKRALSPGIAAHRSALSLPCPAGGPGGWVQCALWRWLAQEGASCGGRGAAKGDCGGLHRTAARRDGGGGPA